MNASVVFLFLVVAGGATLTLSTTTTGPTTQRSTTTAQKTTHSLPTTAPKTTHSQPTTAPKTTHSQPTTAPKTTHTQPTTSPKTTARHTSEKPTETPADTTAADANTTSNATGSTVGATTPASTTRPGPEKVIPSYQFENGSEVMMLFVLNATLKVRYNTTNNETGEVTIPFGGKINATGVEWTTNGSGWSPNDVLRDFRIVTYFDVPDSNSTRGFLGLWLDFQRSFPGPNVPKYPLYNLSVTALWGYYEPIFPGDVVDYGKDGSAGVQNLYTGTIGKAYRCANWTITKGPATIIMDHVMLQPFADYANGTFGDVEDCMESPTTMTTPHPPTKPSPNNAGMIAGIVIGVLAFVVLILGIAVYVVRKRRVKEVSYGSLESETARFSPDQHQ
ncbi:uncharacterized protein LOC119724180 isoform X2 [Patiria miniata]|uniref:Uncharacterized protein n=1 Tax=Patiria miniata TaxID=46514 RepID=A0A913ZJ08_PATMI|nr:uncharacterized protein LOC119724180 isoform X2 [Patiria miniata]